MNARETRNLITALDIGTSKVTAMVAEVLPGGQLSIIGVGEQPSRGLKKGMVVNIESTMQTISQAIAHAEAEANCKITKVWTGIAGSHIKSINSSGMVAMKEREVTQTDIERVIETARAINIPNDSQILHTEPQEFVIDGNADVRQPLGMSGVRLEVKVHIVTGATSAAENITKCVRRCGLEVSDLVLQPLASARAVLTDDEKELGVAVLDIGGGTTDISIFNRGALCATASIPIAGDQITGDIAMALRTPTRDAEILKHQYGHALASAVTSDEIIEVPGVGERPPRGMTRATLAEVISPRVEELFQLVLGEIRHAGFDSQTLSSGLVITGGSSLLPGMAELAEEVFHAPVRIGTPNYTGSLEQLVRNPRYAAPVGLLMIARDGWLVHDEFRRQGGGAFNMVGSVKGWLKRNF
jgi:cell division protein FtsA